MSSALVKRTGHKKEKKGYKSFWTLFAVHYFVNQALNRINQQPTLKAINVTDTQQQEL